MASKDFIGYQALIEQAFRGVLRQALRHAASGGIMGAHHFYIAFDTKAPGVEISDTLKERFPEEMTIVLQHTYANLKVGEDAFEVDLSFNKVWESLRVPYAAVRQFSDPSQNFGFKFQTNAAAQPSDAKPAPNPIVTTHAEDQPAAEEPKSDSPTVVSLDKFRKK